MWSNGHHFRIKRVDDKRKTYDCGISASFEVECRSHANDRQPITSTLRYYGVLEDIIELDFISFKKVLFCVQWYKLIKVGEEKTILLHNNGFNMINTSRFEATSEPYVFPNQCDQIFLIPNLEQHDWSFVIDYDPRGRRVTFNEDVEDHDLLEDAEVPLEDIDDQDEDFENLIVDDAYDQDENVENLIVDDAYGEDEDHVGFTEVLEGQEKPHGHQVHEDDEFIDFHLPVVEGDEDHENHGINLFVDLGPINDGVFMPSDEEISSEDDMV